MIEVFESVVVGPEGHATGQPASDMDLFHLRWGQEMYRDGYKVPVEMLRQIVTLTTALLAGSVGLLNAGLMTATGRALMLAFLLASLGAALMGLLPRERTVDLISPSDLAEFRTEAMGRRLYWLRIAAVFLFVGLACGVGGVLAAGSS